MQEYPGTYLKTKPFEIRYKIVADFLGDLSDKVIIDLNCGEPLFKNHIKFKRYIANDIFVPDNIDGIEFRQCTDTEIDEKCDVLCVFGYGGGELTGEELESKTTGDSLVRLSKYNPKYIVVEMTQKWEDDFSVLSKLKEKLGYAEVFRKRIEIEPAEHYHDKRLITIFKK